MPIVNDLRNGLEQPAPSDSLWRYMDFTKFVDMLVTEELYLRRVDKLTELDKFEGLLPSKPKGGFTGFFATEQTRRYDVKKSEKARRFYYVNCWHGNDCESDAMWKIYVKCNQGIAIRTTVRQLKTSLKGASESIRLAKIKYLPKYEWKNLPDNPTLHACLTKRKSFKHEEEVRVIWHDEAAERSHRTGQICKRVKCDLAKLIEEVYLAPTNSPTETRWFKSLVKAVLKEYNIKADVVPSDLDSEPA